MAIRDGESREKKKYERKKPTTKEGPIEVTKPIISPCNTPHDNVVFGDAKLSVESWFIRGPRTGAILLGIFRSVPGILPWKIVSSC